MFTVLNRSSNALPRSRVTETRIIMTGAAGAIGAATTTMLRQQGAIVVGIDKSLGEGLIQADVRDPEEVRKAVNTAVTNLGGLDVLINNAGIAAVQDTGAEPDEGAIATFEINLLGAWRITAAALPHLLATHGRVVNVASGLAFANVPFAAAYCASKRALTAYSDVLRLEYGKDIQVTTVYPGYVKTPIHNAAIHAGLTLNGITVEESLDDVARTLMDAAIGKPRRDLATTRQGRIDLFLSRHFPMLVDYIIEHRLRKAVVQGQFSQSDLAKKFVDRLGRN